MRKQDKLEALERLANDPGAAPGERANAAAAAARLRETQGDSPVGAQPSRGAEWVLTLDGRSSLDDLTLAELDELPEELRDIQWGRARLRALGRERPTGNSPLADLLRGFA